MLFLIIKRSKIIMKNSRLFFLTVILTVFIFCSGEGLFSLEDNFNSYTVSKGFITTNNSDSVSNGIKYEKYYTKKTVIKVKETKRGKKTKTKIKERGRKN